MSLEFEDESSLRAKILETASTYGEKKSILDARDKLMRLKQDRPTNLADAIAMKGTCMDMCPEMERYFRIETKQVSAFETDLSDPTVADEKRMVKEYRRAGADQKEPLEHELRPIAVLERTMHYLCLEIINRYDKISSYGEWFDFIWSRTRSIRKDITQQHIVTLESVNLIEQCARFHIFCAFFLCQEETRNFDHKINEENLSNCLQTLKDFYYDLTNRSIVCGNESEFRAYDILISLRKGETLSELSHFPSNVRNSPQVRLAISIYQTFATHNYIKFFRYARSANFFMSCILNRYFNHVRIHALATLCKAYTNKVSPTAFYSTQAFIQHFGFDDYEDFSHFCILTSVKHDQDNLCFERTSSFSSSSVFLNRPNLLVWNKLGTSPGEAIIAYKVDGNNLVQPVHSSFDDHGRLVFDFSKFVADSKSQVTKSNDVSFTLPVNKFTIPVTKAEVVEPSNPEIAKKPVFNFAGQVSNFSFASSLSNVKDPRPSVQNVPSFGIIPPTPTFDKTALINKLCDQIYEQNLDKIITETVAIEFDDLKHFYQQFNLLVTSITETLYDEALTDVIGQVVQEVLDQKITRRNWIQKIASSLMERMLNDIIETTIHETYQTIKLGVYRDRVARITNHLYESIFSLVLTDYVSDIFQTERELHCERIARIRAHLLRRKYFRRWKMLYESRKKHRYYRDTLPAISTTSSSRWASPWMVMSMNGSTIIDDQYTRREHLFQTNLTRLRRSLDYRQTCNENNHNGKSHNVNDDEHYLMRKYFHRWLLITKKRRTLKLKATLPAAPSVYHDHSPGQWFPIHSTLIDASIEKADRKLKHFRYKKSNSDYENVVDSAKRKLALRRAKNALEHESNSAKKTKNYL